MQQQKAADMLEREEKCARLSTQIDDVEQQLAMFEDIALVGVKVSQKTYGVGRIVRQNSDHISVQYSNCTKEYVIHSKFSQQPAFENDRKIVAMYSEHADLKETLIRLQNERSVLME